MIAPEVAPAGSRPSAPCRLEAGAAFSSSFLRLLSLFAAILVFAACGKRETPADTGLRTQTLHRALDLDPADLDPHIVTGIAEAKVLSALFEPLVTIDPATLAPTPALAQRWDIAGDQLTYTFYLRPDARWSNGDPLTAQDCIDSWRRILTPSLGADYAYQFLCLKNAQAFRQGSVDFSAVGLAAPDAHTLRVTLERPTPYFLNLLAQLHWAPVHVRSIAAHGDPHRRGTPWTRPPHLIGNGPFTLAEWTPQHRITAKKSPTYWDAAHVRLNAIVFHPIDNTDAQERAFRAGQVHVTDSLPSNKVPAYRRDQPALLRTDRYLHTYFLRFNVRHPALSDVRVRRALSLAIDRRALAGKVLQGGQQPTAALVPATLPPYTPPERPLTDIAAAKTLLAEAGFPEGRGLPPLEILLVAKGSGPVLCEVLQENWRRDLGVQVTLRQQEQKVIYSDRRAGNYQILLGDWVGDYLDPTTFLDLWQSDSANNHTGWKNENYDALLATAALTPDASARAATLQKAESLLLDAAPIAPLYYNTHTYLLHPFVKGWHPTPLDQLNYKRVWLEPTL